MVSPMLIVGDLNADPAVISCLAKSISAGRYVDLALAHSLGAGLTLDVTCRFYREEGTGSRRDFFVGCLNALAASHACYVTDRWFSPHFSVVANFRISAWTADIACPVACLPLWPACWLAIWSRNAELGLAGGPVVAGSSAFLGRGLLRIRSRRLGGRGVGGRGSSKLYRVSQGDEVDVHCAQYFVGSSLAPVLLFRRRLKSVVDVLKGIRSRGVTQSRWDALLGLLGSC